VIASNKIAAKNLHKFHKSFWLSNFEYSEKSHLDVEIKDDSDPRNRRHSKVVDSLQLHHEDSFETQEFKYSKASMEAVNYTRKLSNVRATECDPDYFEN
jgi:leucyl aminopeptidase